MSYRIINGRAYQVGGIADVAAVNDKKIDVKQKDTNEKSFKEVLNNVKNDIKISKHAALRLNQINFNEDDIKNIEKGFKIAENKSAKNTVMIYKDVALIASVENRTLITAVEKERARDNIFTNIDSVIIL